MSYSKLLNIYVVFGVIAACVISSLVIMKRRGSSSLADKPQIELRVREEARSRAVTDLSEYQRIRVITAFASAHEATKVDVAVEHFDELLKDGELEILNEALRKIGEIPILANSFLKEALIQSVINQYIAGKFPSLGEVINVCYSDGRNENGGDFVQILVQTMTTDAEVTMMAFDDLLHNPPLAVHPIFYVDIAAGAASPKMLGPIKALDSIPNPNDGWFGAAAANQIVRKWIYQDAVEASSYIRDLPKSEYRDGLVSSMVKYTAEKGDYEMALGWARSLSGSARSSALESIDTVKDVKEKKRAEDANSEQER